MNDDEKAFIDKLAGIDQNLALWAAKRLQSTQVDIEGVKASLREAVAVIEAESAERQQLFKDVLTNWIDTCFGLWAAVQERAERDSEGYATSVKVQDCEDDDEPIHTVTLDTVRVGFARVMGGNVKALHAGYIGNIAGAYATNDGGMIDADDCDIIVQAGLFNEVIYG